MDPAIKKVAIVIAVLLVVVLGLIFAVRGADSKEAPVATKNESQAVVETQNQETQEADAEVKPEEEAEASEASKTNEAQTEEDAQEIDMYEGALAGLSEEEIAKMALAEEEGSARTETTGIENAVD